MARKYDVGYGKSPKGTQFRKGQSGNPQGRPKGAKNFPTLLQEELQAPIPITEGGQTKVIPRMRAIVKRTVELALKGNLRAAELVMKWAKQFLEAQTESEGVTPLTQDDQAILTQYLASMAPTKSGTSQKGGSPS